MNISFKINELFIDGKLVKMPFPILNAVELGDRVIVLLDPDAYLLDPEYKIKRRQGERAFQNLIAVSKNGEKLWEAEFPSESDYYYRIISQSPLKVDSFSSYECEIDPDTGKIIQKKFYK